MKETAARTCDRILDERPEMLTVTGLAGVTFGSLAAAVGMSKSRLYGYFRSKEHIQPQNGIYRAASTAYLPTSGRLPTLLE